MYKKKEWKRHLKVGKVYRFKINTCKDEENYRKEYEIKSMKLLEKNKDFALLENEHGIKESFR